MKMANYIYDVPQEIVDIYKKLRQNGFDTYLVGGCVRDIVLGRKPKDFDIATSASPGEVEHLFDKTIPVGAAFGTMIVVCENCEDCEVTTFRYDGEYQDGRHPDTVIFTDKLEEDLQRRDFTINAMAFEIISQNEFGCKLQLIDPCYGLDSIREHEIRCVGNPDMRFQEDALRMLRAIRFAAQIGFLLDDDTFNSIRRNSKLLRKVSRERIRDELIKMVTSKYPDKAIDELLYTGLAEEFLPELVDQFELEQGKYHEYELHKHTAETLRRCNSKDYRVKLACLFHDIAKPKTREVHEDGKITFYGHEVEGAEITKEIMERLKFSKADTQYVSTLVRWHLSGVYELDDGGKPTKFTTKDCRKLIRRLAGNKVETMEEEELVDLIKAHISLKVADHDAHGKGELNTKASKFYDIEDFIYCKIFKPVLDNMKSPKPILSGLDIMMALKIKPGRQLGEIKERMYEEFQIEQGVNDKGELLDILVEEYGEA